MIILTIALLIVAILNLKNKQAALNPWPDGRLTKFVLIRRDGKS